MANKSRFLSAEINLADVFKTEEKETDMKTTIQNSITQLQNQIHEQNKQAGWWHDLDTGEPLDRNKGELLCLIHSEISEAMEGVRKDLDDDKLPHRKMVEVELADAVIRILDFAGGFGFDISGAIMEKLEYNKTRIDHKPSSRKQANGKKF